MKRYGVIMAGGGGTRFWPLSRKERPKQLLNLSGKDLMINETLERLSGTVQWENMFIVTNASQEKLMREEVDARFPADHILVEPAARNTAACIGYAAMEILRKYGDGIMCVLPSDHFIRDRETFVKVLETAVQTAAQTDALVTIGIEPSFASTGYGYIKSKKNSLTPIEGVNYSIVEEFVEKPDEKTAKEYLKSGEYLWNSGMFIWKASTILSYMERLLPDVYGKLAVIGDSMGSEGERETIEKIYPLIPKISIDYGIMERADHVLVIPGDFGWNDIGSLDMLHLMKEADPDGNISYGETLCENSRNCIVYGTDKLVAAIGLEDMIVVQTEDVVLVCPRERAQEVKSAVDRLAEQGREQYL